MSIMPGIGSIIGQLNQGPFNFYQVLQNLGLATNLKMVHDAAALASYGGSGQTWADLTAGGYNFYLGSGSGSDAADPTFTGVAGNLLSSTYFQSDGGDYFTYDSANETWMENQHKDGAQFTLAFWVYLSTTSTTHYLWGQHNGASDRGVGFFINIAANAPRVQIANGSGTFGLDHNPGSGLAFTAGWNFVAYALDETNATDGSRLKMNSATSTQSGVITSPSASAASYTTKIGASGSAGLMWPNGERIAGVMAWEGTALSLAQLDAIYQATRGRFGV